jgi:hypothetical protein
MGFYELSLMMATRMTAALAGMTRRDWQVHKFTAGRELPEACLNTGDEYTLEERETIATEKWNLAFDKGLKKGKKPKKR